MTKALPPASPPTVEDVFYAYYDCRKTKRNSWSALRFEENLEQNLMDLYYDLADQTWEPSRLSCFVALYPKPREIWASEFRDRVVQYVFYNRWSQFFTSRFIYDTYACIPGRGALFGRNRVSRMMRQVSLNFTQPASVLKADIANFFVSIDKVILETMLLEHIKSPWDTWLLHKLLGYDVRDNVLIKSPKKLFKLIPKHKSLFYAKKEKGLPIGNLTSQFFANIYLNKLDQYAKRTLGVRYYGRYVDDIVLMHPDPSVLGSFYCALNEFCNKNLLLTFHPQKTYLNKIEYGVDFLGYIIKPYSCYIRNRVMSHIISRLEDTQFHKNSNVVSSVNSYLGMLKHVNGYQARRKLCTRCRWLGYKHDKKFTKLVA